MRQSHLLFTFHTLFGICTALAGCGGNTSDTAGTTGGASSVSGTGPIAIDNLAHEEAVSDCSLYLRCNPAAYFTRLYGEASSPNACINNSENVDADQNVALLKAAIAAGKATYDPASARACFDAYALVACDYSNDQSVLAPCAKAFDGTVPVGGACNSTYECLGGASTTSCSSSTSTCSGVCTALSDVGEPCSISQGCLSDLECDGNVCEPMARVGEPCGTSSVSRSSSCIGLAQCVLVSSITGESRCAVVQSDSLLKENAICGTYGDLDCAPGLACTLVASESTSATNLVYRCQKLAASGAACQYSQGNPCADGQYCPIALADALTGTAQCIPQLEVNQPCTGNHNGECGGLAVCLGGVCVTPRRLGEACSDVIHCYSNNCQNGLCEPPSAC